MTPHALRLQEIGPAQLSRLEAEQLLDVARRNKDRPGETSALTDLGLLALEQGDIPGAVARLGEALALARILGHQASEGEIRGYLGLGMLMAARFDAARPHLEHALTLARTADDRYAQKLILERLGTVHAGLGDLGAALDLLTEALSLARALGDRQHEAELLWHSALRLAELGRPARALELGQAAVQLLDCLGNHQARVYAEHLERYRQGELQAGWQAGAGDIGHRPPLTADARLRSIPGPVPPPGRMGPGFLRMAISAAKALTQFVGSGLKTVPAKTLEVRLQRCAVCSYHTGLRCRICGCLTHFKARLPHEDCPIGQWPPLAPPASSLTRGPQ